MTGEKICEVIPIYRKNLVEMGIEALLLLPETQQPRHLEVLQRCRAMLFKVEKFVVMERTGKAFWRSFFCKVACGLVGSIFRGAKGP